MTSEEVGGVCNSNSEWTKRKKFGGGFNLIPASRFDRSEQVATRAGIGMDLQRGDLRDRVGFQMTVNVAVAALRHAGQHMLAMSE